MTKEKDYRQQSISRIINQMNKYIQRRKLPYVSPGDFHGLAKKIYDMLFPKRKVPINQWLRKRVIITSS